MTAAQDEAWIDLEFGLGLVLSGSVYLGDEPTAEAKLIYRPAPSELAKTKNWKTKDIMITSRVW